MFLVSVDHHFQTAPELAPVLVEREEPELDLVHEEEIVPEPVPLNGPEPESKLQALDKTVNILFIVPLFVKLESWSLISMTPVKEQYVVNVWTDPNEPPFWWAWRP